MPTPTKNNLKIAAERKYMVVKSNELIRNSKIQFSLQEQKALLYIISRLKPEQKKFEYIEFDLSDFCAVSGIQINGKNYADIKAAMDALNRPFWLQTEGRMEQCHFIEKAIINARSGNIKVKIDETLKPYLLELKGNYTEYELLYILAMTSKYSIRLYELLRSWANRGGCTYSLAQLQEMLGSSYDRWQDIKRKVLEIALREINAVTDISVTAIPIKEGRSVAAIQFDVERKKSKQLFKAQAEIRRREREKIIYDAFKKTE